MSRSLARVETVARHVAVALLLLVVARVASADDVGRSAAEVVRTARDYRSALERVLEFRERDVERAAAVVGTRRDLLGRGIVARRDVEDAERALAVARRGVDETRAEIDRTVSLTVEAEAAQERAAAHARDRSHPTVVGIPHDGPGARWSLTDAPTIETFFAGRFGRPLPVSAFGQTALHDRLGFDHRNALDVAVTPDSEEGRALIAYLSAHGVPFLAFRGPRAGVATGAHIHIGPPSRHKG